MSDEADAPRDSLSRIALALGMNVEDFIGGESADVDHTLQCLEILFQIRSQDGKQRAKACLSRIAQEERSSGKSEQ